MAEVFFIKEKKEKQYTVISNTCITDKRISLKAKGLHCYLMSLPEDWKLYFTELITHSPDGRDSYRTAVKELVRYGYLEIYKKRDKNGRFIATIYIVHETPIDVKEENCSKEQSVSVKEISDKSDSVNYKVYENSNSDNDAAEKDSEETVEYKYEIPQTEIPFMDKVAESPQTDYPFTVKPFTDNPPLQNTNNTKILNLKNTNSLTDIQNKELDTNNLNKIIKNLFSGLYPFSTAFESELVSFFIKYNINLSELEDYLKYIFEKTKNSNTKKSFAGLFYKLSLNQSVLSDYLVSRQDKMPVQTEQETENMVCPVCEKNKFSSKEKYFGVCETCGFSFDDITDDKKIQLQKKIFKLPVKVREKLDYEIKQIAFTTKDFTAELNQIYINYGVS